MMKQVELKYTQLIGKALAYNVLASIRTKDYKETGTSDADREKARNRYFKKIGSKKLYGSTLLVDQLMNY